MEGSRKLKILSSAMIVLVLVIVGIIFAIRNENVESDKEDVVLGQANIALAPYITSVSPVTAYIGKEYVYDIKYSDRDSGREDITISLLEAPSWLSVQDFHISGTPPIGSSGQYKFNVKISDGVNSSIQENYILIQENEEE
jgi:hypothetical protein